jgi:hypothetical protein
MDPITIIVAAVVTGAAAGLGKVATEGITDAYRGLKAHLRRQFGWDSDVNKALDEVEQSPETGEANLRSALEAGAAKVDSASVAAAEELLNRARILQSDTISDDAVVENSARRFYASDSSGNEIIQTSKIGARARVTGSPSSFQVGGEPSNDPSGRDDDADGNDEPQR